VSDSALATEHRHVGHTGIVRQVSAQVETHPPPAPDAPALGARRGGVRGADEPVTVRPTRRPATVYGPARFACSTSGSLCSSPGRRARPAAASPSPPAFALAPAQARLSYPSRHRTCCGRWSPARRSVRCGSCSSGNASAPACRGRGDSPTSHAAFSGRLKLDWRVRDRADPGQGRRRAPAGLAREEPDQARLFANELSYQLVLDGCFECAEAGTGTGSGWWACRRVGTATRSWPVARGRRRPQRRA
jgi:hypothetical protein